MTKAIYSIYNRELNLFMGMTKWVVHQHEAARWCADCKQAAYDRLPDELRTHCMTIVNKPPRDGYEYLCHTCEQEE